MNHLSLIFGLCLLGLSHSPVEGFQKMSSPAHVVFSKDENKVDVKLDGDLFNVDLS